MTEPTPLPDELLQAITAAMRDEATPLKEVRVGRYIRIPRSSYRAWIEWLAA